MKILSIGNFGHGWDGSICDEEHIAKALEDLGHEVIRYQRDGSIPFEDPTSFDFTLIAQWDGYGSSITNLPKPLVYWAFDYQAGGQQWHEDLIAASDLYLSKRIADSCYKNWRWLSQDFYPDLLYRQHIVEKDIDVLFTGSYLPWATERNETIGAVAREFNLIIHSVNEWPIGNQGPIMDEGLPALYARAKVILSIDHTLEAGYWSDRNAQIMACGRRPLFRYVPLSESRFHDQVDYFYSVEDCLNKIRTQLENPLPEFGSQIVEFAEDNLSVDIRVKDLLSIVGSIL